MKFAIGSDHRGFRLKEQLKNYMDEKGIDYEDFGTFSEESCDYPDFGRKVAESVSLNRFDGGILICATGIGMSIVANRYKNVRAALCVNTDMAKFCRMHNDANLLVLGSNYVEKKLAVEILDIFLKTNFESGRHEIRIEKLDS